MTPKEKAVDLVNKYLQIYDGLNIMDKNVLDWIVAMDFAHYKTEEFPYYKPSGPSHWYIKGSPERFTSEELIQIYKCEMKKLNKKLKNYETKRKSS
jgi:hypothetical protein